jgi:hypothetical protein
VLAERLELNIHIPDHTTLSRWLKTLGEIPFRALAGNRPLHLLIDNTGVRTHVGNLREPPSNRAWRKFHLAADADSGEIVASDLTGRRTHDCIRVPAVPGQVDKRTTSVSADGAYDTDSVYDAANAHIGFSTQ